MLGVFTKDSRSSPESMLRCAGVGFRGAFVSLPVKMERGSHIEMPRCNSSDRANAFEHCLAGHAAKVGVVQPRLWIFQHAVSPRIRRAVDTSYRPERCALGLDGASDL